MEALIRKIKELHGSDVSQMSVILSDKKRIVVEAPAGYGKTKTMVSKIAFLISSGQIPYPKKILALTFSVNAAYKIKKDVAEDLPELVAVDQCSPVNLKKKVFASNYHGFCRRILRLYGYLLDENLRKIDLLKTFDDGSIETLINLNIGLSLQDAETIVSFNAAVKRVDRDYVNKNYRFYISKIKEYFLPKDQIPFNAIIVLTVELFDRYPSILSFYQKFFPIIIVDEFQDTNLLSWGLLRKLIEKNNEAKIMFMGDPLQRIYGFIGAIPNLMQLAKARFDMELIQLKTNHRFKVDSELLLIDKCLRANAENPRNPQVNVTVNIRASKSDNQEAEAKSLLSMTSDIIKKEPKKKIAILVKQRGRNIDKIMEVFKNKGLDFFYALFSDEDAQYIEFHKIVLDKFIDYLSKTRGKVGKAAIGKFSREIVTYFNSTNSAIESLVKLTETFFEVLFKEFRFLNEEEKVELIKDTLENHALKQYLNYIPARIIISTVHGAKGLEWDYVVLPDMEKFSFPNFPGLCGPCNFKDGCRLEWEKILEGSDFEKKFYDELSVFYVASTRAREKVFFSYSRSRLDRFGSDTDTNPSCLMKLPGFRFSENSFTILKEE